MTYSRKFLLVGAAMLMPAAAFAQAPASNGTACDRLISMLEQQKPANPPVTLDQARSYKRANNVQGCNDALAQANTPDKATGAQIRVEQATPQVTVQQAQPNVTVNQAQPEITVHQPAPTITVDIPQPVITIRMPKPDVNVSTAQPQVQVSQTKPQVQVVQPGQPQVNVQSGKQADVKVQDGKEAPKVNYTSEQAKVVVNQKQGAPTVHMEQAGQATAATERQGASATTPAPQPGANANAQPAANANAQPAANANMQTIQAARLMKMNVVSAKGDTLGDVEHVLTHGTDKKTYVVVGHGGFLGMGEKQVALPIDNMFVRDGKLVMRGMTDEQIKAMPAWSKNTTGYSEPAADQPIQVGTGG